MYCQNNDTHFMVVMRKYVRNRTATYGYVTGISFINQLGLTTQISAIIEIVTNNEVTNSRSYEFLTTS